MKHLFPLFILIILITISCSDNTTSAFEQEDYQIEKRQYIIEGFQPITPCEAADLTYYISQCFVGSGYEEGIQAAVELYNQSETSLHFTLVDQPFLADLIFNCAFEGTCGEGNASLPAPGHTGDTPPNTQTFFPSGGSIGRIINLNLDWTECPCENDQLTTCFFTRSAAHEMAHALGLYHNNIGSTQDYDPIHVEGTPTGPYDEGSIINSGADENDQGNFCEPNCELNENDIIAFQTLYPQPEILGPDVVCNNTSYYFCLPGEMKGSWNIKKGAKGPSNCKTFSWNNSGTYIISVSVCDVSYTKTITVLDCIQSKESLLQN